MLIADRSSLGMPQFRAVLCRVGRCRIFIPFERAVLSGGESCVVQLLVTIEKT